jgi:hypothetical protein
VSGKWNWEWSEVKVKGGIEKDGMKEWGGPIAAVVQWLGYPTSNPRGRWMIDSFQSFFRSSPLSLFYSSHFPLFHINTPLNNPSPLLFPDTFPFSHTFPHSSNPLSWLNMFTNYTFWNQDMYVYKVVMIRMSGIIDNWVSEWVSEWVWMEWKVKEERRMEWKNEVGQTWVLSND